MSTEAGQIEVAALAMVTLTRLISAHHQVCRTCQRRGRLVLAPGGPVRERCAAERELFAALHAAQEAGWPAS